MTTETGLGQCRHLIEVSLGWGDPASWTNEDFDELSDRIFEKTTVRLSVSTLKRIWGKVKYEHSPTTATLNVLARYAGFGSWRGLLLQTPQPDAPAPIPDANVPETKPIVLRSVSTPVIIGTIAVAGLLTLLSARFIHVSADTPRVRFENRRTSDGLPNSVVFDYDAAPLHPQEVIIQQSWDPHRRETVDPNGKQHTSIYYYPGYFSAKLLVDGEIKRESEVFVTTKGWKGIVGRSPLPVYLSAGEIKNDSGGLGITATTLAAKTGSMVFSDTWVTFADVREFPGISGDHFTLTTNLRNTSTVEQCLCRNIKIMLLGKNSVIVIPLSDKGCIAKLQLFPGFTRVDGKDHDLSEFGCDFHDMQRVVCTGNDHMFTIRINDRQVFSLHDAVSIGDIVGMRIDFEGTGEVCEARLQGNGAPIDLLADTSLSR